MLIRIT